MIPPNHCCLHPHRFEQRVKIEKGDWKMENWPERKKILAPFRIYSNEELKCYYSRWFALFLGFLIAGSVVALKFSILQIREYGWILSTHGKWYATLNSGVLLASGLAAFITGFSPIRRTVALVIILNSLAVIGSVGEILYSLNTKSYKSDVAYSYMNSLNRRLLSLPRPLSQVSFTEEEMESLKTWPNMTWILCYTLSNVLPLMLLFSNISVLFTGLTSSVYVYSKGERPSEDNDIIFVVPQEVEVDFENDESVIAPEIPKDDEESGSGGAPVKKSSEVETTKESEFKAQVLDSSESVITPDSEMKSEFADESLPYQLAEDTPKTEEPEETEMSPIKKAEENGKVVTENATDLIKEELPDQTQRTKKLQFLQPVGLSEMESTSQGTKKKRKPITRRKTVTLQVLGIGCLLSALYIHIYYCVISEVNYFLSHKEPSVSAYLPIVFGFYICGLLALGHIRLPRKKWMLAIGGIILFISSVFLLLTASKYYSNNRIMSRQLVDNCINNDNQFCVYECFRPKKRRPVPSNFTTTPNTGSGRRCLVFCTPKDNLCDGYLNLFEMTTYSAYLGNFGCTFSRFAGEYENWNKRKFDYYWPSADEFHCHERWIWWHLGAYFFGFYGLLSSIILLAWAKKTIDTCMESYKEEVFGVCSSTSKQGNEGMN